MASCSQTGIYILIPPVDFNCVCCQSRWLSRSIRCEFSKSIFFFRNKLRARPPSRSIHSLMLAYQNCISGQILNALKGGRAYFKGRKGNDFIIFVKNDTFYGWSIVSGCQWLSWCDIPRIIPGKKYQFRKMRM